MICKISNVKNWACLFPIVSAFFAGNALAQCESAQLPIRVSSSVEPAAVLVSAVPQSAAIGTQPLTLTIGRGQEGTMALTTDQSSISHNYHKNNAPAIISHRRGNVSLNLQPEAYQNAQVSLHSVNGKLILGGRVSASKGRMRLSRSNIAAGAYVLSVKGASGYALAAKVAHGGGKLDINAAFSNSGMPLRKRAAMENVCGVWIITASANGYQDYTYAVTIQAGMNEQLKIEQGHMVPETTNPSGDAVLIAYGGTQATVTNPFANIGAAITVNGQNVTVNATVETAAKEIEYILSGNTTNGSFKIYSDYRFKLTFNGVSITNPAGPAINIQSGKRATVTISDNTANTLTDGQTYQGIPANEEAKSAFFSEGQLIFGGNGSLNVEGKSKHAICSDDWIRINSGNITLNSASDGIHTNDSLVISGGKLSITAKSDGIDVEAGALNISGGEITVASSGEGSEGFKSEGDMNISGAAIKMTISGAGGKGLKSKGNMTISGGEFDITVSANAYHEPAIGNVPADNKSAAGFKGDANITISGTPGPVIKVTATGRGGKGINTVGTLTILGGTIDITTSGAQFSQSVSSSVTNGWVQGTGCGSIMGYDCTNSSRTMTSSSKGIKSQGDLTINGGVIKVKTSTTGAEGIESKAKLNIGGGEIIVNAYDDAINSRRDITIIGGKIFANSSNNDGIDVNGLCWCGSLFITGGTVITAGTTGVEGGTDGDFEYTNGSTHFKITGGTFVAIGGHAEPPTTHSSNATTQRTVVWNSAGNFSQNQLVSIKTTNGGSEIMSFKSPRQYSSSAMVFSSPQLQGSTGYTIYKGGNVSGGTEFNGFYTGATSIGGSEAATFTTSNMVTTIGGGGGFPW